MKLYTEKQVRQSLMKHQNSAMLLSVEQIDYLIEEITPIELPSDGEIERYAFYNIESISFEEGAKWMRDLIQGDN